MSELGSPARPSHRIPRDHRNVGATIVLVAVLLFFTVPLLYLVSVSFMGRDETGQGVLIPSDPQWSNWTDVIFHSDLLRGLANSLIAAIGGAAITLLCALPAAWAIVRYRTGGASLGATLMSPWLLPPIVAVVPLFALLRVVGLNNTLLGLTLVYALVNIPVAIWLLEGFIHRLPIEIEEAARIDGAGSFRLSAARTRPGRHRDHRRRAELQRVPARDISDAESRFPNPPRGSVAVLR
jgi:multiple sugar transport system permease protein